MIKAILFDYDNTLEEFIPAESMGDAFFATECSKKYGFDPREFLKVFNKCKLNRIHRGNMSEEYSRILWLTETLARMNAKPDYDYIDKLVVRYWDIIEREAKLFPGTLELLKSLKKKYKTGLISDSDGDKRIKMSRLKKVGIIPYLDTIVTSDDTGFDKPDVRMFKLACTNLKVEPNECVMVGDSPERDVKPAKQLGMTTVLTKEALPRAGRYKWADFEIRKITELGEIMKKI